MPWITIRFRGTNVLGGNDTHPRDDPLWETPEVEELVSFRVPMTAEEKKLNQKRKNAEAYKKSKDNMAELRARLAEHLAEGRMTQDDVDSVLLSRLHGQYRVKYREGISERKRLEAEAELERTDANLRKEVQTRMETQQTAAKFRETIINLQTLAKSLTTILTEI